MEPSSRHGVKCVYTCETLEYNYRKRGFLVRLRGGWDYYILSACLFALFCPVGGGEPACIGLAMAVKYYG